MSALVARAHDGDSRRAPCDASAADDGELVRRVQRGDTTAYDVLVRRYLRRAFAVARRLLENTEDAEDLVQDAFIRALSRIHSFDSERPFGPWFFRLLVNAGLNARKARSLRHTEPEYADAPSPAPPPDLVAERRDIHDRFTAALDRLTPQQRLVVTLIDADGMASAEVAQVLGVTQTTVRWHLLQARRVLRRVLFSLQVR